MCGIAGSVLDVADNIIGMLNHSSIVIADANFRMTVFMPSGTGGMMERSLAPQKIRKSFAKGYGIVPGLFPPDGSSCPKKVLADIQSQASLFPRTPCVDQKADI